MSRDRLLLAVIGAAAFFAFYLPTSVDGVISRPLSVASIAGTAVLLGAMLWLSRDRPSPLQLGLSTAVMAVPTFFTITSPFEATSPGVVVIYLGIALLCALDLHHVDGRRLRPVLWMLSGVSLAIGYALALDVRMADTAMVKWYAAFYPELVSNMVVLLNKPVLTFATHSMAGFMFYLLFYLHFQSWRGTAKVADIGAALGYVGLLFLLRSTTGFVFGAIASLDLLIVLAAMWPRQLIAVTLVSIFGATMLAGFFLDLPALAERVSTMVVGDRVSGLFARYAADGLLSANLAYLSRSPFAPIGFSATESLYLGDSGLVLNTLRGSVLLLVLVYGAFWFFLRSNLSRLRVAAWVWLCVVAFEVGFTPLQYFRFVAFAPLFVVILNSVAEPVGTASRPLV